MTGTRCLLAVALVAAGGSPALATAQFSTARVDSLVEARRQSLGIDRLALSVIHPLEVMHEQGYGASITPDTPFPLGLVRRPVIATLVFQLVDGGLLDVGAPITAYLPPAPALDATLPQGATVGDLLRRSHGLTGVEDDALVRVLEAVTGRSLDRLVATRICAPLAVGCADRADSAVGLSAREVGAFLRAHLNLGRLGDSTLLSSASVIEMTTFDSGGRHAAGWDWRGTGGGTAIGASGRTDTAQGELVLHTTEGVGVVLLAVGHGAEATAAVQRLAIDVARVSVGLDPLPLPRRGTPAWALGGAVLVMILMAGGALARRRRRVA